METLELTYIDENTDIDALLEPYMAPVEVTYLEMNNFGDKAYHLTVTNDETALANIKKIAGRYLTRQHCFENYDRLVLGREPKKIWFSLNVPADKLLKRLNESKWIKSIGGVKFKTSNV